MKRLVVVAAFAVAALWAGVAAAGVYHAGESLICYDCHTMHFSMQHGWSGGTVGSTPAAGGDWLGTSGAQPYLLKAPANELCLQCHDGQSFAPDALGVSANAMPQGREAGGLNRTGLGGGYDTWKGHTLDSTDGPPGFDASKSSYNASNGLECISCHVQHGSATRYRNLGPRRIGGVNFEISYVLSNANDSSKDVWIDQPAGYVGGSGTPSWGVYDSSNVKFNRNELTTNGVKSSNKIGVFCSYCHYNFHGAPGDAYSVGGTGGEEFIRHPTAQVTIGALGGGHSSSTQWGNSNTRVKVATTDFTNYTNSSPICVTCHKGHGNLNPFGLVFLSRNAASVTEEGGFAAGQTANTQTGLRNLCGQCHVQGN